MRIFPFTLSGVEGCRLPFAALAAVLLLTACDEKKDGPAPSRFAAVKKSAAPSASAFCEKSYPATGEGARAYLPPATRPFGAPGRPAAGWRWVNVWATWCQPCVEEMGVLTRWRDALEGEGLPVTMELVSIDDDSAESALKAWREKKLPGAISWLRSEADLGPFLDGLGVERGAAIPIHALVDPTGALRCVRVGAIHEANYGQVRDVLAGK